MQIGKAVLIALAIVAAASSAQAATGPIDELKLGIIAHDVPIGDDRRETGADFNGEVLFVSPSFLAPIWAPRPHIGVSINSAGGNSYAYVGLTWTASFWQSFFADLGLGGAVHDGPDESTEQSHLGLGTRFLFHESVELGYRFLPTQSIALFLDHISNADIGSHNPGITNLGLRYGIAF